MSLLQFDCIYCGFGGVLEVRGAPEGQPASRIFRYLGNNPCSGHMHYRCPACGIVLLVDPAGAPTGRRGSMRNGSAGRRTLFADPWGVGGLPEASA